MASSGQSVLCVYRYDGLDRLADCSPAGQGSTRLFYQKTLLATQIQGQIQHTLMRTDEHLLACLSAENNQRDGALLATDQQHSATAAQGLEFAYTPYGHRHPSGSASLPGFTGQRVDPVTGHYLLGNGYRAFNPVLMRFNSPDSLSPFGEGGVNAYGYCGGDPVNRVDPSGHMFSLFRPLVNVMRFFKPKPLKNMKIVSEGLISFEDTANGAKRINFYAHGYKVPIKEHGYHQMRAANQGLGPEQLYNSVVASGVNFDKYKQIRLVMCYSATGGDNSFAASFSKITKKPVKGYISEVFAYPDPEKISSMIVGKSASIRWLGSGKNRYDQGLLLLKSNIHVPGSSEYSSFSYNPVIYKPTKLRNK
ncbi:RHS repeat-associated core domain-containing protein [Pseudomonas syringae]|uniref:RHS repeat-associated core domain-containing protein n=1 Tax=Pseudomonas syringae TaxID=317 RepID=UPI000415C146|nr:RHS repeat-associated core domain-containing protein [Pseudomonas syringae]